MINSNKIKGRLRELNLTQKDAAEALGIAQSTMAQKPNGTRPMTIYEAEALAELLEIEDMQYGVYFLIKNCIAQERKMKKMDKQISKGEPPQVIGGDRIIYGICPKCGGRYVPGSGYAVYPNFYNEPIYRCLDCGFEYIAQAEE